jgi:hypothetical protein
VSLARANPAAARPFLRIARWRCAGRGSGGAGRLRRRSRSGGHLRREGVSLGWQSAPDAAARRDNRRRSAEGAQERVGGRLTGDPDVGIDGVDAVGLGDNRVEVEFGDFGQVAANRGDAQQRVGKRGQVGSRGAAVAKQQRCGPDRGRTSPRRCRSGASRALWSPSTSVATPQVRPDGSGIAFVQQAGHVGLDHHGANLCCGPDRSRRIGGHPGLHQRHAVAPQ